MCVWGVLRSRRVCRSWGAGRQLAGSWILSGVHQSSLCVRVNGFKMKCA